MIIGGGDTGADCLGTCHRQKAAPRSPVRDHAHAAAERAPSTPWPMWPMQLRIESSHEEGGVRDWSVATTSSTGDANGNVKQLHAVRVGPPPKFEAIPAPSSRWMWIWCCSPWDSPGPCGQGMIEQLGVALDARGNVAAGAELHESVPGIFAAGDMRRGQSLVVWAIAEGRSAARCIDEYLMGSSQLL